MSITWGELRKYIDNQCEAFLSSNVMIYDFNTGDELSAGLTELLLSEEEEDNGGWVPYITINESSEDNNDGQVV